MTVQTAESLAILKIRYNDGSIEEITINSAYLPLMENHFCNSFGVVIYRYLYANQLAVVGINWSTVSRISHSNADYDEYADKLTSLLKERS